MESILISACLLGVNSKYNGGNNLRKKLLDLKGYNLIPVCPEQLGGLSTPRSPSEIRENKVLNDRGEDVTEFFVRGAEETLKLAKIFNCKMAILKESSPSCGVNKVYDGSFSGNKIDGMGMTTSLLSENGIEVISDESW